MLNFPPDFWNSKIHRTFLENHRPKCFLAAASEANYRIYLAQMIWISIANAKIGAEQRKINMEDTKNQPRTALPELTIGQKVLIQNPLSNVWDNKGKITSIRPNKRSYDVVFDTGKTYLRNRKFLRPINTTPPSAPSTPNSFKLKNYWMAKYEEEFPPLKPALRRSTRIANKNSKVTFGKNTYA